MANCDVASEVRRASVCSGRRRLSTMSTTSRMADRSGSPHQKPRPSKMATNTGASTVPRPNRAFSTRIERSTAVGLNAAVNVLSAGTQKPKPAPRLAVARSSSPYARPWSSVRNELTRSSTIARRLAQRPARYTRLVPKRPASPAPRSAAVIAVITWGRKRTPYCVFERSYSEGSVRIVLAAGKVTSAMPCTTAAALTTVFSVCVATLTPGSGSSLPASLVSR